jgi:hypothetical protein
MVVRHLGTDTALYRSRYPKSWSWDTKVGFLSEILFVLQGANWQRQGGKGDRPKRVSRPSDDGPRIDPDIPVEMRKAALDDELARRRAVRARRNKRRARPMKSKLIAQEGGESAWQAKA